MKGALTQIGNSKGIILPAKVLRQCGFDDEIEIEVRGNSVIISPATSVREGWEEAFAKAKPETALLPDHLNTEWDDKEWQW